MDILVVSEIDSGVLNQEVQVRGFLYQADDGRWILSDQPGLKSCCVGAREKMKSQIVVDGPLDFEVGYRPVVIKGVLTVQSEQMHLSGSALVAQSSSWWVLIPIILILASLGVFWRRKKCK